MEIHILYGTQKRKKNFGCVSVCLYASSVDTITFEGVCGSKQKLVGIFYIHNVFSSVIEI